MRSSFSGSLSSRLMVVWLSMIKFLLLLIFLLIFSKAKFIFILFLLLYGHYLHVKDWNIRKRNVYTKNAQYFTADWIKKCSSWFQLNWKGFGLMWHTFGLMLTMWTVLVLMWYVTYVHISHENVHIRCFCLRMRYGQAPPSFDKN